MKLKNISILNKPKTIHHDITRPKQLEHISILNKLKHYVPEIIELAQKVYDEWDEDDIDTYANGGICHIIADAIAAYFSDLGLDTATINDSVGDVHVWTAVSMNGFVYRVDIPPSVYESGGGYSWKKLPNVKFTQRDIIIEFLCSNCHDEYFE